MAPYGLALFKQAADAIPDKDRLEQIAREHRRLSALRRQHDLAEQWFLQSPLLAISYISLVERSKRLNS